MVLHMYIANSHANQITNSYTYIIGIQLFICSADVSKPTLRELCENITPHYAKHWKRIGVFLDIRHGELDAIELDCLRNCCECCDRMLAKWLDVDTTASWEKLKKAVTSATLNSIPNERTSRCIYLYIYHT